MASALIAQEFKECEIVLRRSHFDPRDTSLLDLYVRMPNHFDEGCYRTAYHDIQIDDAVYDYRSKRGEIESVEKLVRILNKGGRNKVIIEHKDDYFQLLSFMNSATRNMRTEELPEQHLVHCEDVTNHNKFEFPVYEGLHPNCFREEFRLYILVHEFDVGKCRAKTVNFVSPWVNFEDVME